MSMSATRGSRSKLNPLPNPPPKKKNFKLKNIFIFYFLSSLFNEKFKKTIEINKIFNKLSKSYYGRTA